MSLTFIFGKYQSIVKLFGKCQSIFGNWKVESCTLWWACEREKWKWKLKGLRNELVKVWTRRPRFWALDSERGSRVILWKWKVKVWNWASKKWTWKRRKLLEMKWESVYLMSCRTWKWKQSKRVKVKWESVNLTSLVSFLKGESGNIVSLWKWNEGVKPGGLGELVKLKVWT